MTWDFTSDVRLDRAPNGFHAVSLKKKEKGIGPVGRGVPADRKKSKDLAVWVN
jgi:hypothetical protein